MGHGDRCIGTYKLRVNKAKYGKNKVKLEQEYRGKDQNHGPGVEGRTFIVAQSNYVKECLSYSAAVKRKVRQMWKPVQENGEDNNNMGWKGMEVHVGKEEMSWNEAFFEMIVSHMGRFVSVDIVTKQRQRLDIARVLIHTTSWEVINRMFTVKINEGLFSIRVVEEPFSNPWNMITGYEDRKGKEVVADSCESESMSSDNASLEFQNKIIDDSLFEFEFGSNGGGLYGEIYDDYEGVIEDNKGGQIDLDGNGKSLTIGAEERVQIGNGDQSNTDGDVMAEQFQELGHDTLMVQPTQVHVYDKEFTAQTLSKNVMCARMKGIGSGVVSDLIGWGSLQPNIMQVARRFQNNSSNSPEHTVSNHVDALCPLELEEENLCEVPITLAEDANMLDLVGGLVNIGVKKKRGRPKKTVRRSVRLATQPSPTLSLTPHVLASSSKEDAQKIWELGKDLGMEHCHNEGDILNKLVEMEERDRNSNLMSGGGMECDDRE
ncbi:hypothetical protein SESBI_01636 [Sesbania bispinosa]|nr:hypothetical protein SESBI_01636 [Sesbania bispinosa]